MIGHVYIVLDLIHYTRDFYQSFFYRNQSTFNILSILIWKEFLDEIHTLFQQRKHLAVEHFFEQDVIYIITVKCP